MFRGLVATDLTPTAMGQEEETTILSLSCRITCSMLCFIGLPSLMLIHFLSQWGESWSLLFSSRLYMSFCFHWIMGEFEVHCNHNCCSELLVIYVKFSLPVCPFCVCWTVVSTMSHADWGGREYGEYFVL